MEHDGDLSAGGVALCGEGRLAAGGDAGDDAAADGPLHRRDGEGTDLRLIGVAAQRTGHGRAARVAVQDGCDLLTGDVAIRVKGRGGRAVDNALVGGPENRVVVILALLVVGELVGDTGNRGFACCYGVQLTLGDMAMIVLTATLASVGTAGVSGAGMIMLAMVLTQVGLPVEGIAIIAGVDKIFDMGRTTLNITGDATCALFISRLEREKAAKKAAKAAK